MAKEKKSVKNLIVDTYRKVVGWKWFWIVANLSLALIIVLVLIFGAKGLLNLGTNHGEHLVVPEFVGMTYKDAQAAAEKAGVRLTIVDSVYAKKGRGLVREQTSEERSSHYDQTIAKPYETGNLVEDISQYVDEIHIVPSFLLIFLFLYYHTVYPLNRTMDIFL